MTTLLKQQEHLFCCTAAQQAGLDPGGYGGAAYETIIAAELPLPWPRALFGARERIGAEIMALIEHIRDEYQRSRQLRIRLLGIAPDAEYSVPGMRRAICWRRPDGPCARFEQQEYLVPERRLGALVYALALAPERLGEFAPFGAASDGVRDLLVCTHGTVDAACSKFGYPAYRRLRRLADASDGKLRAWRTTHFGGHVFAPTLIDLPHGSYWAYIGGEEAEQLVGRSGDPARLYRHYRGWAGLAAPFLQVLERELWVRHGWAWLDYLKTGRVLAQDDTATPDQHGEVEPRWAVVRLDFAAPDGSLRGAYTARVELERHIETIYATGSPETYPYPQYVVTRLDAVPPDE